MRRGFTLVELLITTGIIAILAGLVLFTMVTAQSSAKAAKTKTIIATLDQLMMERYDSYNTRRVSLLTLNQGLMTDAEFALAKRKQRLNGIRRLMQLEMPERWSEVDVALADVAPLSALPGLNTAYKRRYDAALQGLLDSGLNATDADNRLRENQGAETLYLVVTLACGDGESLEHFKQSDINDTDQDGLKEFVDGWGRPISWLRWPAGVTSDRQSRDPALDHDPFDTYNIDPPAYRLVPLIYSGGVDQDTDVAFVQGFSYPIDTTTDLLNPYAVASGVLVGQGVDSEGGTGDGYEEWYDNIYNHFLNSP